MKKLLIAALAVLSLNAFAVQKELCFRNESSSRGHFYAHQHFSDYRVLSFIRTLSPSQRECFLYETENTVGFFLEVYEYVNTGRTLICLQPMLPGKSFEFILSSDVIRCDVKEL